MPARPVVVDTPSGAASVEFSRPSRARAMVLLTHGAGGGVHTADVLAVRAELLAAGAAVGLVTQAYRVAGRRSPPAPGPQDVSWTAVVTAITRPRGLRTLPLVLGGRSNGARVACRTATACGAAGVVALAFPLHPPGRPEVSRAVELDGAGVPVLVVQGDRDPFGLPAAAPGREVVVVPGADHALRREPAAVASAVRRFVDRLLDPPPG